MLVRIWVMVIDSPACSGLGFTSPSRLGPGFVTLVVEPRNSRMVTGLFAVLVRSYVIMKVTLLHLLAGITESKSEQSVVAP